MEKNHRVLDTGGGRDVKIGSDLGMERVQAQFKWEIPVYDECCKGTPYRQILATQKGWRKGWGRLGSETAVQQAAKRYADRHRLEAPPKLRAH